MKKNNSVVAYVAVGDTSALPTVSDSCEASVGKVRQGKRVRESVSGKHQRCVSESCSTKKGMNHCPSLNLFDRYQFNLFLLTMSQICNP